MKKKLINFLCAFPLKLYHFTPDCGSFIIISSQQSIQSLPSSSVWLIMDLLIYIFLLPWPFFPKFVQTYFESFLTLNWSAHVLWLARLKRNEIFKVTCAAKALVWSRHLILLPVRSRCPRAFDFRSDGCVMQTSFSQYANIVEGLWTPLLSQCDMPARLFPDVVEQWTHTLIQPDIQSTSLMSHTGPAGVQASEVFHRSFFTTLESLFCGAEESTTASVR